MAKAKEIVGLECAGGAGAGVRLVLLSRFEEMCEYRAAVFEGDGVEGVHDMRVASRRLRSVVRDFAPHLARRGKRLEAAREALRRVAEALGGVRDEDVAIGALEKLKADAPPEVAAGLEEFAEERRARQTSARAELEGALDESSLEEARRLFKRALEGPARKKDGGREDEAAGKGAEDSLSFEGALRRAVVRLWSELRELGPSLYRPHKTRRLHKARIAAKRLRYALELLAACRGAGPKELASEVADLQGALGDLHDCDDWIAYLGGQLREGHGEHETKFSPERRRAAHWLLSHFVNDRARHYADALSLWETWQREDFAARIEKEVSD